MRVLRQGRGDAGQQGGKVDEGVAHGGSPGGWPWIARRAGHANRFIGDHKYENIMFLFSWIYARMTRLCKEIRRAP
jgi:hypothetical protein